MRKLALSLSVLSVVLAAGCGAQTPSQAPTATRLAEPTSIPSPTSAPSTSDTATTMPSTSDTPTGPASCVAEPFDPPIESRIPPIDDDDYTHGSAEAPITLIEYADFQ
jgi:hypothetical protein